MTVGHFFYQLLIRPLETFFEVIYCLANEGLHDVGLSVIVMSLTMNFLLLPLYKRADAVQEEERAAEKRLSHWVRHIKKTFRGDERFMMLQTYYRQNGYKPFYVLKGFLPLMLEIPFFMAAYHFLTHLTALRNTSFLMIDSLGAPDGIVRLGSVRVNLMPIIMTLINCLSGAIYTKGLSLRDKLQLYGMAAVFLVLLYDSPAGLVLYWTINNLFSLVKNLIVRYSSPRKALRAILAVLGLLSIIYGLWIYDGKSSNPRYSFCGIGAALFLPLLWGWLGRKNHLPQVKIPQKPDTGVFAVACALLFALVGLLIPSAVIRSSPAEFVQMTDYYSPLLHILNSALMSLGLFVVWFGIFYYMFSPKGRWGFGLIACMMAGCALINYLAFGDVSATLSSALKYDVFPHRSKWLAVLNAFALLAVSALIALAACKKPRACRAAGAVLLAAALGMSGVNCYRIHAEQPALKQAALTSAAEERAHFPLSKKGRNVVVIMLDRAIGSYVPYIFQELPFLREQYAGFTYYPNTLSFGGYTNFGSSALFGGYEYSPDEMNKRSEKLLRDKHNEALCLMPYLFDDAGYEVTVCDPPYTNYQWIPDMSIYKDRPDIHTCMAQQGQFSLTREDSVVGILNATWERNFFMYGLMKTSPLFLQGGLYHHGDYFKPARSDFQFYKSFAVLCSFDEMTQIVDSDTNTFFMIANDTTHEPTLLSEPDYMPADNVDNEQYEAAHPDRFTFEGRTMRAENRNQLTHYQTNAAALIQLGNWLDYLRENNVYDNTRIIIVADHGRDLGQFDDLIFKGAETVDIMLFNPLLLYKDFGDGEAEAAFKTDQSLMTNADVPTLAFRDLISEPVNPFTGHIVSDEAKHAGGLKVISSSLWNVNVNNGAAFLPGHWYTVGENILDPGSWHYEGQW